MLSNSRSPLSTSLHPCTSTNSLYSYCPISTASSCTPRSHFPTSSSPLTFTTSGSVLINNPTISSTPPNSPGRPLTVTPNITSSSPLYRLCTTAHPPFTTVFSVTCHPRPTSTSRLVSSSLSRTLASSYLLSPPSPSPLPSLTPPFSTPNRVPPLFPFSFLRQYSSAP